MEGKVAIVTGAAGAIGSAICAGLARRGAEVVLVARNQSRARDAVNAVLRQIGTTGSAATDLQRRLHGEAVDLSNLTEVRGFVRRYTESGKPLHVLINNACIAPRERLTTVDGLEEQVAVNILSYYLLTRGFEPLLKQSAPSRVVMVASYWAGGMDLTDLQFERRRYNNDSAYRQSKQADRMLAVAFSERLRGQGVSVNSCHPGDVRSKLSGSLGFGGHETADQAASTPLLLAAEQVGGQVTGRYFEHGSESRCSFSANPADVSKLWKTCEQLAGDG